MKTINLNRLEKICGHNLTVFQKQAIYQWGKEYEDTMRSELEREYKQNYGDYLGLAINHFLIAIAFVLHFGEKTKFGNKRLHEILRDIEETVDMFNSKEYSAKEYVQMLNDDGIQIKFKLN